MRAGDPMLAALRLFAELNRSGKREVPADAPRNKRIKIGEERRDRIADLRDATRSVRLPWAGDRR